MAASYTTPGVYVEEVVSKSATLSAGATAVAAFVGFTEKAPPERPEEPQMVTNWTQFEKLYGGFTKDAMLPHSVYGYFLNGGSVAYIVRIPHTAVATDSGTLELTSGDKSIKKLVEITTKVANADVTVRITKEPEPSAPAATKKITAAEEDGGTGSDAGKAAEQPPPSEPPADPPADPPPPAKDAGSGEPPPPAYTIEIIEGPKPGEPVGKTERFEGVRLGTISDRLNQQNGGSPTKKAAAKKTAESTGDSDPTDDKSPKFSEIVTVVNGYDLSELDAVLQTLPVGDHRIQPAVGSALDKVPASSFAGSESARTGINGLTIAEDVTMVIVPDLVTAATKAGKVDHKLWKTVQLALVNHCEGQGNRMAVLDPPPDMKTPQQVKNWRTEAGFASAYGALYYPWIEVDNPAAGKDEKPTKFIPPSGHMAGIWARTDETRGVWKAPANEVVRGVLSVETPVNGSEQGQLNPIGVNCIRPFGTQGIRVWGARTLAPASGEWVYINVRRLFNMIEQTILTGTQYAVFEPNDQELWEGLKRTINSFLRGLWRDGALFGATAEQAFYAKCDEETNPPDSIAQGRVIVEVGIAPVKPAEFVIFRIAQIKDES